MFRKGFEDWCRDNEKRETLENVILFGELLLIDLNNRLDVAQQSVHPTKGGLVLRACVNGECGWVGKESACLTWKHAGDERMCPHCNDNTESVSLSALRG